MTYSIVVGYDGSEQATKALDMAVKWAQSVPDAEIVVACSNERPDPGIGFRGADMGVEALWDELERKANALLDEAAARVQAAGVKAATACTPDRPDATIINIARDVSAELIVVGTKGTGYREGQRSVLGSTTTRVLHEANGIPVLVV